MSLHVSGPDSILCLHKEEGTMTRFRTATWVVLLFLFLGAGAGLFQSSAHGQTQTTSDAAVLARVEVKGPIQALGLPIYAHLQDGAGNDYALVIAPLKQITGADLSYLILDDPASSGTYYLALERRKGARQAAVGLFTILHDDGRRIVVKGGPGTARKLSEMGFAVSSVPTEPMILRAAKTSAAPELAITYNPTVAAMINLVQEESLYDDVGNLSGINAVTIGGSSYTIKTRSTPSGTPIQKATQYVYERMEAMGLSVSYQDWSAEEYEGRNVIGSKTGTTKPTEIVLVTAHLDDMPESATAPGADDNASGCAALLTAAGIVTSGAFERTIRFVFFTGEEQGLYGSAAYAAAAFSAGENIVAVYNLDMISWDAVNGPTLRLHTRTSSNPGYSADMAIANTFSDVVNTYGFSSSLTPIITSDGEEASDHYSFWHMGYPAILAIEDDIDDFNDYYHTPKDTRGTLNMTYFTNYTKASVGTAAHLALPSGSSTVYALSLAKSGSGSGTVTSSPSGINCGSTCSATYNESTLVTLTANPASGSTFTGWSGPCTGTGACLVNMTTDITATARFALTTTTCTYTIAPGGPRTFPSNGGSVTLTVKGMGETKETACPAPTITPSDIWITTTPSTWTRNQQRVKVGVAKNDSSIERGGDVAVADRSFEITQKGAMCAITKLTPPSQQVPVAGSSYTFEAAVTPQDCSWRAASNRAWIQITSGTGTGTGNVGYTVPANTTKKTQSGAITVTLDQNGRKKNHTVRQAGK
jgi:hypothetical protein